MDGFTAVPERECLTPVGHQMVRLAPESKALLDDQKALWRRLGIRFANPVTVVYVRGYRWGDGPEDVLPGPYGAQRLALASSLRISSITAL